MVFKVNDKADWTREVTTNNCLTSQPLKKWVVVYVAKNAEVVKNFVNLCREFKKYNALRAKIKIIMKPKISGKVIVSNT